MFSETDYNKDIFWKEYNLFSATRIVTEELVTRKT